MPPNTVKVDRSTPYGNPHDWRDWRDGADRVALPTAAERDDWCKARAAQAFEEDLKDGSIILDLSPLRGANLACWCSKSAPKFTCHADVLLERANAAPPVSA